MVIEHYSALAREDASNNAAHIKKVAESFGYDAEDLAAIPEGANLGLSCGNPLAVAGLKSVRSLAFNVHLRSPHTMSQLFEDPRQVPWSCDSHVADAFLQGETVLDLGSGAGFDVFQAARKVGPEGLSIGVDMSQDMLSRAEINATKGSVTNVKFVLSPITKIPLEAETLDCVISNCVINLLEESQKKICFAEVYRLLKPGGRLAVSDILAKKLISDELRTDLGLYVGCISGASLVDEYEAWLREVGFEGILPFTSQFLQFELSTTRQIS